MNKMMPLPIVEKIEKAGIIAVLIIEDEETAVPLAKTLINSGITVIELTLRTATAIDSLKSIISEVPELVVGAGTVLTKKQLTDVKALNADFAVAPGLNPKILKTASKISIPFAPGICTPSEIEYSLGKGCRILKFFHAEGIGGIKYLKAINSPYSFMGLKYIPLGGLNINNIRNYLEAPEVIAIGGSWIAPLSLINKKDWDTIARNADEAVKILKEIRG